MINGTFAIRRDDISHGTIDRYGAGEPARKGETGAKKYMLLLQQDAQKIYEEKHTRQQFIEMIGRNYLED